jgi:hypothetical protein
MEGWGTAALEHGERMIKRRILRVAVRVHRFFEVRECVPWAELHSDR